MAHGSVAWLEDPTIWRQTERPRIYTRAAQLMSGLCGAKITETSLKDAKRRGAKPADLAGCIATLTDDDRRFLTAWFCFFTIAPEVLAIAEMLCEPGSAAAEELDDLFEDAFDDMFDEAFEQDAA